MNPTAADEHDESALNNMSQQGQIISCSNVIVRNLTIDGLSGHNYRQGIITDFRNNTVYNNVDIEGVTVRNTYRRGIQLYSSDGPSAPKSTGDTINGCSVSNVTLYEGIL